MSTVAKQWKVDVRPSDSRDKAFEPNRRILVVDDEKEIGQGYLDILCPQSSTVVPLRSSRQANSQSTAPLSPAEFEVVVVHSADEALAHVSMSVKQGCPFAMGFFDVLLGEGMDGFELVKRIHEMDPELYAVFVTAYNDRSVDSIRSFLGVGREGRWDYLNKPFSKGEILQKARNFTTLWNLQAEKSIREQQLADVQRRLLESDRLSSVAAVARGVTHEFGNILMQIMGKADVSRGRSEEHMRMALDKIIDATQRASDILEKFKDLSGPGPNGSEKESVLLIKVVDEVIDLMDHSLKVHGIKACVTRRNQVLAKANSTGLLQVLVNLTLNSIYAMGESGQIDYSVNEVGEWAEVRVRDYGPGIPKEILSRVVDPFFTTKGKNGTGLGLAISREIIEIEHAGQFEIYNHGLKGVEVLIRLPLRPQEGVHEE